MMGSSPIKDLTLQSEVGNDDWSWFTRLPQSITNLEFYPQADAEVPQMNFPNLQHLTLRGDTPNRALMMFGNIPSLHTVTLDAFNGVLHLPKSCTLLNSFSPSCHEGFVFPRVKHLHLDGLSSKDLESKMDTSQVENFTITLTNMDDMFKAMYWPSVKVLNRMVALNAKFIDPILNQLLQSHAAMVEDLEVLQREMAAKIERRRNEMEKKHNAKRSRLPWYKDLDRTT